MSQKERSFQSKPRRGGQKFGGRDGGGRGFGDKPRGRGEGRKFSERNEGDRGGRRFDRDSRPPRRDRDGERGDRPFKKREFGGEGRKSFGDRDSRPARRDFGDRPFKKREFDGEERNSRPRRDSGDKPFKKREFGDKPFKDRPFKDRDGFKGKKSFGDKKFGDKKFGDKKFGDRPFKKRDDDRSFKKRDDDREAFLKRKYDGPPQKSYERYDDAPRKDYGARLKSDRPSYGSPSSAYLYGVHAVTQALLNPKRVHQRLLCTEKGFASLNEAWQDAEQNNISLPEVVTVESEDIDRLLPRDAVHQDVLLDTQPLEETFLQDVLTSLSDDAVIVVLDQVTDPHNVGAILRSAAAFGAIGVVMQKLHAPETTGTLAKSASGAVEHVPLIREVNLSRALEQLKEAGFFCIGLAEEGKSTLAGLKLTGKTALVLGAEGAGLRRLVAENCDELARLPTQEPIGSLNVSNAAAVALYELTRTK